jgi:threonine dehydrogenase-like Zn-dependent dehydrogenase
MRAVQKTGAERASVVDVPLPVPGSDEVLVRVRACAICASALAGWRAEQVASATPGQWNPSNPGLTGHEIAGDIVGAGVDVPQGRLGEAVWIDAIGGCGDCSECSAERYTYCAEPTIVSQGFADYVVAPAGQCFPIPPSMRSYAEASLIFDMVGTPLGATRRARIEPGESVAVWGLGPVGLGLVQGARIAQAGAIIGVDPIASRRDFAAKLGATALVDPTSEDAVARVRELTSARGADVVVSSVASDAGARAAFDAVRMDGRMVTLAGFPPAGGEVPKWVSGNWAGLYRDWPDTLGLLERGEFRLDGYITHTFSLEQVEEAFSTRLHSPERSLKVVIEPTAHALAPAS